ncbi:MAG: anaerobic ribonucleoside-triphosphate reductase activating protein [Hydrogeniiclostridium sp.]
MKLRIAGTVGDSIVDGPGLRLTVFTQGCPHHCPGCHNPQTHDFSGGYDATVEELFAQYRENPLLRGVTLSGGEPFCQPAPLAELARLVHEAGGDVFCYTGYTYEQLLAMDDPAVASLLDEVDVLIDGPFLLAERDLTLLFRGSANQRLLDVPRSRAEGRPVWWEG